MEGINVVEVLKVGLPGLVFLLSVLAYRLLSQVQEKDPVNLEVVRLIKSFMYINVLLAVLTGMSPLMDRLIASNEAAQPVEKVFNAKASTGSVQLAQGKAAVCHNTEYANRYLLIRDMKTNKIVQVFAEVPIPCTNRDEEQISLDPADANLLGWEGNVTDSQVEVVAAMPGYKFAI